MLFFKKSSGFNELGFKRLVERIKKWEDYSETAYYDPPNSKRLSWGYGTLAPKNALKDKLTISEEEAERELIKYLKNVTLKDYAKIEKKYPFTINEVRKEALCDMLYNLGYTRFKKFKLMLKWFYNKREDDWHFIAAEALDSDWYKKQCKKRAERISYELDTGEFKKE